MNAVSVDIKDILEDAGLGLTFGSNLFIGKEPPGPVDCVTIFDVPGAPDLLTFDIVKYEYPSIQIRVRNRKYIDGWTLANNIKNTLHGYSHQTINGTYYDLVYCVNGPAMLDIQNDSYRFIMNFNILRR